MPSGHTVVAFDTELTTLHRKIAEMGGLAEEQLMRAMEALVSRDENLASSIIGRDAEIDRGEAEVEALAVRVLALRQPMAKDLRQVITALKVSNNLERIGDFASNCAKRVMALSQVPPTGPMKSLNRMGVTTAGMVHDVVKAYVDEDYDLAMAVRDRDAEVDAVYTSLFRELLTYMMESPQQITACTHLMFIAKNLERVGDHATNVAETVCFLVKGRLPGEERMKEDLSSFTVVNPREPQG
ncbi:phosphate signaling complex protein PhoU [Skermanella mucosa]|uniref:phosphate signaling complex protein PhoU n=1 Tax=Skermanella mucosa TaxID=1789672 RepID=UPI00192C8039|nr:phosphate signaling complex protein PhoU [Skermanella mucosa]UEM22958.1 phosphate signaling complex protein PhoU [Skermanella mucosa]